MANPLVNPGVLNRLRASVLWTDFQILNVSAPYLGKEGIRIEPEGDATTFIEALTGVVISPEPYIMVTFRMALLKTQPLAAAYKAQWEVRSNIGNATIRPDSSALPPFIVYNCAIQRPEGMAFNGQEAVMPITCRGTYYVNSSLFDAG